MKFLKKFQEFLRIRGIDSQKILFIKISRIFKNIREDSLNIKRKKLIL